MCISANDIRRSLPHVNLKYVLIRFKVLNDLSHEQLVIVQWLSSQICNVCALLETSTKFGILVDMAAAITSGYIT